MSIRKVIDYTVVLESIQHGYDEFIAQVKEKFSEGWYPLGGPFLVGKDWSYMLQALVKYEETLEDVLKSGR